MKHPPKNWNKTVRMMARSVKLVRGIPGEVRNACSVKVGFFSGECPECPKCHAILGLTGISGILEKVPEILESPKMKGIGILGCTPIRIPNH